MDRRDAINAALSKRRVKLDTLVSKQGDMATVESEILDNTEKQEIARKAAKMVQDGLGAKLSGIVTRALVTVFEEDIEFVVQFVERRGVSECDLFIRIGEHFYDPLKGQGGGVADICSICLQMAFIIMSGAPRILFIDEPARHTDSVTQERLGLILQQLCEELQFTIVMVTHSTTLLSFATRVFSVVKSRAGVSNVVVQEH